jgi:hypothetical protein
MPSQTSKFIRTDHARLAYRIDGPDGSPPILLAQRFRGTMDDWDPLFIAGLASTRRVIRFDNAGVGIRRRDAGQRSGYGGCRDWFSEIDGSRKPGSSWLVAWGLCLADRRAQCTRAHSPADHSGLRARRCARGTSSTPACGRDRRSRKACLGRSTISFLPGHSRGPRCGKELSAARSWYGAARSYSGNRSPPAQRGGQLVERARRGAAALGRIETSNTGCERRGGCDGPRL